MGKRKRSGTNALGTRWKKKGYSASCFYCGMRCTRDGHPQDSNYLTVDHVIPVALGGDSSSGNLRFACRKCNSEKGMLPPGEFVPWNRR